MKSHLTESTDLPKKPAHLFKPGKSGNPAGRPPDKPLNAFTGVFTPKVLENINKYSKEELIELIKKVGGSIWGIAMMTPEQIASAMKLKLASGGLSEAQAYKALPLMKEWFDRELGKASQSIQMTVEDKGLGKLSDERLLRLEHELSKMTGSEAVLIAPEPKKLDIVPD